MDLESVCLDIDRKRLYEPFFSDAIFVNEDEIIDSRIDNIKVDLIKGTFKDNFYYKTLYHVASFELCKNFTINHYKDKETYAEFLQKEIEDLPSLIFLNGNYYIWSNGNHRLVLAKLVGIEEAKVVVNHVSGNEEKRLLQYIN